MVARAEQRLNPVDRLPAAGVIDRLRPLLGPRPRPVALVRSSEPSQKAHPPIDQPTLQALSDLHGVPPELLVRQVELMRQIAASIEGRPRSYRNVSDKIEDVQRASLWLMSGATTQAGFRRFFGTEGFMRPTKSVAWDFFNRVFKRGPFAPA